MKYLLLILGAVFIAQMLLMCGCAHKQKTEEIVVEQQEISVDIEPVVQNTIVVDEPVPVVDEIAEVIKEASEEKLIEPTNNNKASNEQMLNVGTVYFDFDKYELKDKTKLILNSIAEFLRVNNSDTLLIEGHTDERGTHEYNKALGLRRARAVNDYLILRNIDNYRIEIISYGEERPTSDGHYEGSWLQNRRAEIIIK